MNRLSQLKSSSFPQTAVWVTGKRTGSSRTLLQAVRCALRGLLDAWRSQPNLRLHVVFGAAISAAAVWCRLTSPEWVWVSFSVGLVVICELLNTAMERLVDLTVGVAPDPAARFIKDVAAGMVLVAVMLAVAIGLLIFLPHLQS